MLTRDYCVYFWNGKKWQYWPGDFWRETAVEQVRQIEAQFPGHVALFSQRRMIQAIGLPTGPPK